MPNLQGLLQRIKICIIIEFQRHEPKLSRRYLKDAIDYDVSPTGDDIEWDDEDGEDDEEVTEDGKESDKARSQILVSGSWDKKSLVAVGQERLLAIYGNKAAWQSLPTTKKVHKQRRVIDRRFDGPKNRRTRDYDSQGGGDGCVVM